MAEQYRQALDAAIREYEALGAQRREIDERLAQLAQVIGNLNRLCGFVSTVPWGLTDACRVILKNGFWLDFMCTSDASFATAFVNSWSRSNMHIHVS